jgi:hypothetical protein
MAANSTAYPPIQRAGAPCPVSAHIESVAHIDATTIRMMRAAIARVRNFLGAPLKFESERVAGVISPTLGLASSR